MGSDGCVRERFRKPVFIVSTPRSGSTLLFETLAQAPELFSIAGESHSLIEGIASLSPPNRGWDSNRLTADDASGDVVEQLASRFYDALRDRDDRGADGTVRMLEKTPKNALRVPFLATAWPEALFVYLYRDPRQTLASMIEAWASGRFRTYPALPGWQGYPWSLLLVPGWRELNGLPLPEIVARQWTATTEVLVGDLKQIPASRIFGVRYDDFLRSPQATMEALTEWAGLGWDRPIGGELPLSRYTVSRPHQDKWRRLEAVVECLMPSIAEADQAAMRLLSSLERNTQQ